MTVKDIYSYIDSIAEFSQKCEWDNCGLLVGNEKSFVKKVLVCLDVTNKEIEYAKENAINLIISHHPVIFKAQKNFLAGNIAFEAAENAISIICAHTNLDKAFGGVNDTLCEALELPFEKMQKEVAEGCLNIAYFDKPKSPKETALYIKERLHGTVNYSSCGKPVSKIGICSGAGADFIKDAISFGCDGFITGDATYHDFLDAKFLGISLFAAGHFETEVIIVKKLCEQLRRKFNDIEFFEAQAENCVLTE